MAVEHTYRILEETFTQTLTPLRAIRKHCLDCSAGSSNEVRNCVIEDCALYPFRYGRRPVSPPLKKD